MRAGARSKGRAADERPVFLGRGRGTRSTSYAADPNYSSIEYHYILEYPNLYIYIYILYTVYIYIDIYMYMYVSISLHIRIYIYIYIYIYTYGFKYVYRSY